MLPFDATKYMPRSERPASAPSSSHASSHRRSGSSHHSRQTQWPPEFVVRHVDQDDLYRAELAVPHPPGALPRCHTPASSQGIGISSGAVEYVSDSESPRSARDSVFERISRPVSKCAMRHPDHGVAEQNDIAEKIHQRRLQSKLSNIKRLILHVKMQQTPLELKPVLYRPIQSSLRSNAQSSSQIPVAKPPWKYSFSSSKTKRQMEHDGSDRTQSGKLLRQSRGGSTHSGTDKRDSSGSQPADDDADCKPFLRRLVPFIAIPHPPGALQENPYRRRLRIEIDAAYRDVISRGRKPEW